VERFASWTFRISALYGTVILFPLFFAERTIAVSTPPPITHPEYFYGFLCTALATQGLYFWISTDPLRYRPLMLVGVFAKFAFAAASCVLAWQGRLRGAPLLLSVIDLAIGMFFLLSFVRLGKLGAYRGG
jgi:hypothetical protein